MLDTEKIRLLREAWEGPNGAQRLAEELFTILKDTVPFGTTTGPITINQPAGDTTPGSPAGDNNYINFTKNGVPAGGIGPSGKDGAPGINGADGQPVTQPTTPGSPVTQLLPPDQVIFLCQIQSGAGDTYTVNLYPNGKDGPPLIDPSDHAGKRPAAFTAKVVEIADDQIIPVGRWFLCVKVGPWSVGGGGIANNGILYLQAPIFEYTG